MERRRNWPWGISRKGSNLKAGEQQSKRGAKSSLLQHSIQNVPTSNMYDVVAPAPAAARVVISAGSPASFQDVITCETHVGEAKVQRDVSVAEERAKSLAEKLTLALEEVAVKEELGKQQQKVASEAVLGWEKSKKEIIYLKQELQSCLQQKTALEEQITHLDGALKECMKQVREVREEEGAKAEVVLRQNTLEWQKVKSEMESKLVELERRLMESEAQNSAMTKSLQERARAIVDASDAKAAAETQAKVGQVRIESIEKEVSALQYELHVLGKELEIRNEEREYSRKASEAAHKQHLDNVKKIAKLEADCQRLRNLVKKKLPGPAALAQMRTEVDGVSNVSSTAKLRRRSLPSTPSALQQHYPGAKEIEMLRERMMSMEEETKILKEALARKNDVLESTLLYSKTASKLPMAEEQLDSLQATPKKLNGLDAQTEASIASMSDHDMVDVEEVSCAESWASALITELAQFNKKQKEASPCNSSLRNLQRTMDESSTKYMLNKPDVDISDQGEMGHFQVLDSFCKDLGCTLSLFEKILRANSDEGSGFSPAVLEQVADAQSKVSQLGKTVTAALMDGGVDAEREEHTTALISRAKAMNNVNIDACQSSSHLKFILCKLIFLIEMLHPCQPTPSLRQDYRTVMKDLVFAKNRILEGEGNIMEFLLRMGLILSALCNCESSELQNLLPLVNVSHLREFEVGLCQTAESAAAVVEHEGCSSSEGQAGHAQLKELMQTKADLEQRLQAVESKFQVSEFDLVESKQLVDELQAQISELMQQRTTREEAEITKTTDLQEKLEKAKSDMGKLQASVASLTVELADERKRHEATMCKCEQLERELQAAVAAEQQSNSGLEERSRKEREVASAKQQLEECQRIILSLGKQLAELTSPRVESPGASFDSSSVVSLPLEAETKPALAAKVLSRHPVRRLVAQQQQQHNPVLVNDNDDMPVMSAMSSPAVSPSRYMHQQQQQHHHHQQQGNHNAGGGGDHYSYRNYVQHAGVRTSLTKAMATAAAGEGESAAIKSRRSKGSSGLGRLFSRSKDHT